MCFIGERRKSQGYDFQGNESQVIWCHSSPRHFLSVGSAESVLTTPWSLRGLWGQSEGRDQQELACTTEGCLPAWAAGPLRPLSFWLRYFGRVQAHSRDCQPLPLSKSAPPRKEPHPEIRTQEASTTSVLCSYTHTHVHTHNTQVQTAHTCAYNTHNTRVCAHECRQHTCIRYTYHTHVHTQIHMSTHNTHNTRVCTCHTPHTCAHNTHATHVCTHKYTCPHMCTQYTYTQHTCAHNTHACRQQATHVCI